MELSVSFLSSNTDLKNTILKINETKCNYIHVDYMDGKFVPHKSFSMRELKALDLAKKELDVHLMVEHPLNFIPYFKRYNCKYITFHIESLDDPKKVIKEIRKYGIGVGIAINPGTSVVDVLPYIPYIDLILVMSVVPGLGGQEFMMESLDTIKKLKKYRKNVLVSVDGGVNDEVIKKLDTDIVVCGSYICKSKDYNKQVRNLMKES